VDSDSLFNLFQGDLFCSAMILLQENLWNIVPRFSLVYHLLGV
jgi:hypothetical protein